MLNVPNVECPLCWMSNMLIVQCTVYNVHYVECPNVECPWVPRCKRNGACPQFYFVMSQYLPNPNEKYQWQAVWVYQVAGFMTKFRRKLIKFDLRKLISALWCSRSIAIFSLQPNSGRLTAVKHWTSSPGASLVLVLQILSVCNNLRNLDCLDITFSSEI